MDNSSVPSVSVANPFFDRLIARWRDEPDHLFAVLNQEGSWHSVSVDDVMRRACRFMALYQACSAKPGNIIMLVLRPDADAYAAFLGAMLGGFVPSFLSPPSVKQDAGLTWRQHRTAFEVCRPSMALVDDELLAPMTRCAEGSDTIVVPCGAVETHAPALVPACLPDGAATCLLQHSSGTTGVKKAVMLSYDSVVRQLASCANAAGLDRMNGRIVSWLPLYHDMGLISSFLLPTWIGAPIVALDPFVWVAEPSLLLDAIQDHGATHAWLPNFAFLHLARRADRRRHWDLSSLHALINCSEPCKPAAFDAFLDRFASCGVRPEMLLTSYAMAETVFAATQSVPGRLVRRLAIDRDCITSLGPVREPASKSSSLVLLSNGPPVLDCRVAILRDGGFVGEREIGEICVLAPYLMSGYFNNPVASAAAFHGPWYKSGDLGFMDGGELFIAGRCKDVVIVNGKNIFAHDVEAAVSRVDGVRPGRCVAFGFYSERAGSELLVVMAERLGDRDQDGEIIRLINHAVVEEIGLPCSDIRMVEAGWLVKTTSGKMSRSENARRYSDLRQAASSG